jgi:hypothetical protein
MRRSNWDKLRVRSAMRRYGAESIQGAFVPRADRARRNSAARATKADLRAWGEEAVRAHRERQQRKEIAQRITEKHNAQRKDDTDGSN